MSVVFERRLPYRLDLLLPRGSKKVFRISLTGPGGSSPFDLTEYSVRSVARATLLSDPVDTWLSFSTGDDPTLGVIIASLGATATLTLPGTGVYDVEIYKEGQPDEVIRIIQGTWMVSPEVTT